MQKISGFITARDGVELAYDAWLPDGASAAAPVPAVVTRTPYNRWRYHEEGSPWPRLVDAGYAHVGVDVRGRAGSPGHFVPFVHDGYDGYDVVEWVGAQEWCTGNVGGVGGSYDAVTQYWAARHQPPSLKCMIPIAVSPQGFPADRGNLAFSNGVAMSYWIWWFAFLQHGSQKGVVQIDWDEVLSHPVPEISVAAGLNEEFQQHWDDYINSRLGYGSDNWAVDPASIQVPALVVNGLWDDPKTFEWWEDLVAHSPATHRLLAGPWDHAGNVAPRPVLGGIDVSAGIFDPFPMWIAFLDEHLKGALPAPDAAPVTINRSGAFVWETHQSWPCQSAPVSFDLPGTAWKHDPRSPLMPGGGSDLSSADSPLGANILDSRADVSTFDLPEATEDEDYSGQAVISAVVAQEHPGTFVCWISDIGPDGDGMRMGFWPSVHAHPGGGAQALTVRLPHMHHRLLPGHHFRVSFASSLAPVYVHGLVAEEVQLVSGSITLPREP